jgi:hypothetical protein
MNKYIGILAFVALIIFSVQVFSDNKADVDLWGNASFVKAMPWDEHFKYTNTFSFTDPGYLWVNHEWLGQYILHFVYSILGNPGLIILKIALGLVLIYILNYFIKGACASGAIRFFWLLLVISTVGYGFSTRPHLFTYVIYAAFLFILKKYHDGDRKSVLYLPLLGLLWVNLHGAFFIGVLLLLLYIIFSVHKRRNAPLIITTIILATFTLINPYGLELWKRIFLSATKYRPYLSEWSPFNKPEYIAEHIDFILLSILSFTALAFSRSQRSLAWTGVLFASFASAILIRRNIPLFAITTCFVVPEHIEDLNGKAIMKTVDRLPKALLAVLLSIFIMISGFYTFTFQKPNPLEIEIPQDRFPVAMVSYMKMNDISGNLLVFFDWAEYCIWKLFPDCRVFLDGRLYSAYSVTVVRDFFNFIYLKENWENAFNDYPVDIVLLHKKAPVYEKMLTETDWALVAESEIAGLFLKKEKHESFLVKKMKGKLRYPDVRDHEFFP